MLCVACAGGPAVPTPRDADAVARPLEAWRAMGLLAGPPAFPAVIDLATLAGPADSTFVIVAMSLPNSALRFEREGSGFTAAYAVTASFRRDTVLARRFTRREVVRVGSFAETTRTDESVIFQQAVLLAPGPHTVEIRTGPDTGERAFLVTDTIDVPRYATDGVRLAGPLFVHEGSGRTVREALPQVILSPRHTAEYGGRDPKVYLEWYGPGDPVAVELRLLDAEDAPLHRFTAMIPAAETEVRGTSIDVPIGSLPLGRLWLEASVGGAGPPVRAPLALTISEQWMVADFEEVLAFLAYIATPAELGLLREGTPRERRERWDAFWRRRDPVPATPANEFRDMFFDRVRYATEQFREPGVPEGWRSDRGEVWIVLGPPAYTQERYSNRADLLQPDGIEWIYDSLPGGRLSLLFLDRTGFGRYDLTPSSESAFRAVADAMIPR